ncbi:class I SAM-dependent methyltransferase [Nocardia suismassiliense]|uniref:Class I SAM-dependent methyltransferase n=1 Tax=Nocardia suismassiliense TaxID=2077092 RepID=A0ABW6QZ27_9NOCA
MANDDKREPEFTPHPVSAKTIDEIAVEWDRIAFQRVADIESGHDSSYVSVLMPSIIGMLPDDASSASVLDVGCGTGVLGRTVAPSVRSVVGVDPSVRSIEIARTRSQEQGIINIEWLTTDVETLAMKPQLGSGHFDIAIANMILMNTGDLAATLLATASLCRRGAKLIWTITHPCFWPLYWKYNDAPWFNYDKEIWVEAEFRTATTRAQMNTTHIHRPLERYLQSFINSGFMLTELKELMPRNISGLQPELPFPRFLAGSCILV